MFLIVKMVKAPYVKLYTILKAQNLSSDSQVAGDEVCFLFYQTSSSVLDSVCLSIYLYLLSSISFFIYSNRKAIKIKFIYRV